MRIQKKQTIHERLEALKNNRRWVWAFLYVQVAINILDLLRSYFQK